MHMYIYIYMYVHICMHIYIDTYTHLYQAKKLNSVQTQLTRLLRGGPEDNRVPEFQASGLLFRHGCSQTASPLFLVRENGERRIVLAVLSSIEG